MGCTMYNIGIVGFGVVGRSILTFLNEKKGQAVNQDDHDIMHVSVWDARLLSGDEQAFIKDYGAAVADPSAVSLEEFLKKNDYIVASPGIDLNAYQQYSNKFLCELDFFSTFFAKPTIAITGSLGKTTITKLLGNLTSLVSYLPQSEQSRFIQHFGGQEKISSVVGGNIGIGMLDLVGQQEAYDLGVLELSSFQLELNKKFSPDIAILTNIYANHLDRHQTIAAYGDAKLNVMRYQRPGQVAVLPFDLLVGDTVPNTSLLEIKSKVCVVASHLPDQSELKKIKREEYFLFYAHENVLWTTTVKQGICDQPLQLFDLRVLPSVTFLTNWLQVLTTLYVLGADLPALEQYFMAQGADFLLDDHHHRVEHFVTINGVEFYNDSKSTVIQATQAAVEKLSANGKPLILIVGGLGKGVDRSPLMTYLRSVKNLKKIYCFGKDCSVFSSCAYFPTLEETVADIATIMQPGDQVLFSPSGTSFDLFKNYEHRGKVFKELVLRLKT